MRVFAASVLVGLIASGSLVAADDSAAADKSFRYLFVSAPKLKSPPSIDGTVDPREWADAGTGPRMSSENEDRLTDLEGKFYYGYTDDALYFAYQIQRPADAIEPRAVMVDHDRSMWRTDDILELYLTCLTRPEPLASRMREFYLMWNARGTKFDRVDWPVGDYKWEPHWQCVSRIVAGYGWEGEVKLPLADLKGTPAPRPGDVWHFNLVDNQATPFPRVAFTGWTMRYAKAEDFSRMRFTGTDGPFVRVLDSGVMRATSRGGAIFEVVNPGAAAQSVAATLKLYRRKDDAKSTLSYLRSFDQTRDTSGTSEQGKVLLMVPDDKLSEMILRENYDLAHEKVETITLDGQQRRTIDFALAETVGDYLLMYEFRGSDGSLIAGGPLPFIIPEPLGVKFSNFLLAHKSITAKIDLRYIPDWKKDGSLEARVGQLEQKWTGEQLGQSVEYKFSIQDWPAGNYTLHLIARDSGGKVLAERRAPVAIPETPKWFASPVGYTPAVPEPWTPIVSSADAKHVSFLMGEYELGELALADQINVRSIYEKQKVPILRGPIALRGKVGGADIAWRDSNTSVKSTREEEVRVAGAATAGNLLVSSDVTFEYDGMAKIVLTLAPAAGQTAEIDELYLEFPLKKEFSSLYLRGLTVEPAKNFFSAGKLPDEGLKHIFCTSVWLGNEERGFRWFAENLSGWAVGRKFADEAIEVLNSPDGATLKLNFIKDEKPFVLDKPRTITLAYMFTPPKTIRKDLVNLATTLAKEFEAKAGVNAMEVWYFKNQGWPEIYSDDERREKLAIAQQTHPWGMKVTPYSGWFIHRDSIAYRMFGGEMIVDPLIDGGVGCDVTCWNTPVQDVYSALLYERARDVDMDGYRLDAGFSAEPCSSLVHSGYGSQCGWIDDKGNVRPSRHLFAARRAAQRGYRVFHGGAKSGGIVIQHVHGGNRYDPILSHMDAVLSVEGAEMLMRSLEEFPLDFYRANVMGDAHGYQVIYLPKAQEMGIDAFHGLAMLHNFNPRGGYPVAFNEVSYSRAASSPRAVWRARQWIGPFDDGTEFWGYWKNEKFLQTGDALLPGSFHVRRGEKLLLGVLNMRNKPVEATVRLDLKALGFNGEVHAFDPILGEPLTLQGDALILDFTPQGYRAVQISSQPFDVFVPERIGDNLIPEASPAQWTHNGPGGWTARKYIEEKSPLPPSGNDVIVRDGTVTLVSDGQINLNFTRHLGEPGKFYMLEVEAFIDCADGVALGSVPIHNQFFISFGDLYLGQRRTMVSQPLPGRTQRFRLYGKDQCAVNMVLRKAKGRATIKKLEVYQIKSPLPGMVFGKYGE